MRQQIKCCQRNMTNIHGYNHFIWRLIKNSGIRNCGRRPNLNFLQSTIFINHQKNWIVSWIAHEFWPVIQNISSLFFFFGRKWLKEMKISFIYWMWSRSSSRWFFTSFGVCNYSISTAFQSFQYKISFFFFKKNNIERFFLMIWIEYLYYGICSR